MTPPFIISIIAQFYKSSNVKVKQPIEWKEYNDILLSYDCPQAFSFHITNPL